MKRTIALMFMLALSTNAAHAFPFNITKKQKNIAKMIAGSALVTAGAYLAYKTVDDAPLIKEWSTEKTNGLLTVNWKYGKDFNISKLVASTLLCIAGEALLILGYKDFRKS